MFWNDYANSKVIFWRKRYWDMKFQLLKPVDNQKIIKTWLVVSLISQ